ncbi:MAG: CRISPR-associated protein Cas5 [Candidatus Methanoperedens sp.]
MQVLKFEVEIPYWCSFKQFGTVNIQQTYPFPPPPTIFGMIQNALGKPQKDYTGYEKLKFAVIVRDGGEKLDDYSNIMKGNRGLDRLEPILQRRIKTKLKMLNKNELNDKTITEISKKLMKYGIRKNDVNEFLSKNYLFSTNEIEEMFYLMNNYWSSTSMKYEKEKIFNRTQVTRQKLINPKDTIFIKSDDAGEHSLINISEALRHPKRPLYLGESDDFVIININKNGIIDVDNKEIQSSQIKSVIPDIHMNSHVVKIPNTTREQENTAKEGSIIVSIPKGDIGKPISCYEIDGENIVFL